jgi:hypothetical protein
VNDDLEMVEKLNGTTERQRSLRISESHIKHEISSPSYRPLKAAARSLSRIQVGVELNRKLSANLLERT